MGGATKVKPLTTLAAHEMPRARIAVQDPSRWTVVARGDDTFVADKYCSESAREAVRFLGNLDANV